MEYEEFLISDLDQEGLKIIRDDILDREDLTDQERRATEILYQCSIGNSDKYDVTFPFLHQFSADDDYVASWTNKEHIKKLAQKSLKTVFHKKSNRPPLGNVDGGNDNFIYLGRHSDGFEATTNVKLYVDPDNDKISFVGDGTRIAA